MEEDRPWSVQSGSRDRLWNGRYKTESRIGSGSFGAALLVFDNQAQNEKLTQLDQKLTFKRKVMKQVFVGGMDPESTKKALAEADFLKTV
jgi:hypothetical protein